MRLAAASAPEVLIAESRLLEAKGRHAGARALGVDNPVIEGLLGSNENLDNATEIELQVPLGFGLQRVRRVAEASAGMEREGYLVSDVRRRAVGLALAGYCRVLHAERRKTVAEDRRDLARELHRIASEKVRTGDAARLELLVAEGELSRAESEVLGEEGRVTLARAELAAVLGLASGAALEISGDLADRTFFKTADSSLDPGRRADVLAAESEVQAAEAAVSLAQAAWLPEFSFQLNYQHSHTEEVVRPGLAVTLPLFNFGQGPRGEAKARRERARIELGARQASAMAEAEGARSAYRSAVASLREIDERGLPRALETETLAQQGYEAGKLDLPALLMVRASALETRREHADGLLAAALAYVDLGVSTGASPTY
jgi:cobalt-zinc-cadmium efflux system outer membrane protein